MAAVGSHQSSDKKSRNFGEKNGFNRSKRDKRRTNPLTDTGAVFLNQGQPGETTNGGLGKKLVSVHAIFASENYLEICDKITCINGFINYSVCEEEELTVKCTNCGGMCGEVEAGEPILLISKIFDI